MAASPGLQFCFVVLVVVVAININISPPSLSRKLQEWKNTGKYFNYRGNAVFYRDKQGKAGDQNSVVICIHGFPTSSFDWSKIWPKLEETFGRVIALDMIGLGFSDKPIDHDYTVKDQADIHEVLLRSLGVKRVHIIAHDLGDTVGQELLARYEERRNNKEKDDFLTVQSLCLSNGGIFPETNHPRIGQKILVIPRIGPFLSRFLNYQFFSRSFSAVFDASTQPSTNEMEDFWAIVSHKNGHLVVSKILDYIQQRRQNRERWVGVLQTTTVPVHLIYGTSDPVNPPEMLQRFRELVPRGSFTSHQDIGHYPQWEDSMGFISSYMDFIQSKLQ